MEHEIIQQRYQILKKIGNIEEISFWTGLDLLTSQDIYIATLPLQDKQEYIMTYYHHWVQWTQQFNDIIIPIVNYGKHKNIAFFISHKVEGTILSKITPTKENIINIFLQTLTTLQKLPNLYFYDLSPYQIIAHVAQENISFLFFGISSPLLNHHFINLYTAPEVKQNGYQDECSLIYSIGTVFFQWSSNIEKNRIFMKCMSSKPEERFSCISECINACRVEQGHIALPLEEKNTISHRIVNLHDSKKILQLLQSEDTIFLILSSAHGYGKTTILQSIEKSFEHIMLFAPLLSVYKTLSSHTSSWKERFLYFRKQVVSNLCKQSESTLFVCDDLQTMSSEELSILYSCIQTIKQEQLPIKILATISPEETNANFATFWNELENDSLLSSYCNIYELTTQKTNNFQSILLAILGIDTVPKKFMSFLQKETKSNLLYTKMLIALWIQKKLLYKEKNEWKAQNALFDTVPSFVETMQQYIDSLSLECKDVLALMIALGGIIPCSWFFLYLENVSIAWTIFIQLYAHHLIFIDTLGNIHIAYSSLKLIHLSINFEHISSLVAKLEQEDEYLSYKTLLELMISNNEEDSNNNFINYSTYLYKAGLELQEEQLLEKYLEKKHYEDYEQKYFIGKLAFQLQRYDIAKIYFQQLEQSSYSIESKLYLANIALQEHQFKYAKSLLKKISVQDDSFLHAILLYETSQIAIYEQKWDTVDPYFYDIWKILETLITKANEKIVHFCITFLSNEYGFQNIPLWGDWIQKSCNIMQRFSLQFRYLLGKWKLQNNEFLSALELFQKNLEEAINTHNMFMEIQSKICISAVYCKLGVWNRAQTILSKIQQLYKQERIQFYQEEILLLQAQITVQNDIDNGINLYEQAINLSKHHENIYIYVQALLHYSSFLLENDITKAQLYLQECQYVIQKYHYTILNIQYLLLYSKLQRIQKISWKEAQATLSSYLNTPYAWKIYAELGEIWCFQCNLPEAMQCFRNANTQFQKQTAMLSSEFQAEYKKLSPFPNVLHWIQLLSTELNNEQNNSPLHEFVVPSLDIPHITQEVIQRQYNEQQKELQKLYTLLKINQKLTMEHNIHQLLDLIMDTAIEITHAERGFLILTKNGQNVENNSINNLDVARNYEKENIDNPEFEISHSIIEEVILTGLPILTSDAMQDERFEGSKSVEELSLHSVLAIPLCIHENVLGALYLDNRFETAIFTEKEKFLVESFANQAAIAIHNARLFEENEKKQQELQRSQAEIESLNIQLQAANKSLEQKIERNEEALDEAKEMLQRNQYELETVTHFQNIIGKSKGMQDIFRILDKIADKNIPVFIYGESGTGKELVAQAIHFHGCRKDKNFLSENCAALHENLLASELFGHVKGAFTGAIADKKGLFELADGGSLFLDEVGDMSPNMQSTLLRVLENNKIRRVGGKDEIDIDVRIISASNKNLLDLVSEGKFREDLFFRLKVVQINLPSLRERKEDLPLLAQHFLKQYAQENNEPERSIEKKALAFLSTYQWPGNIRELKNVLYNVLSLYDDPILQVKHFQHMANATVASDNMLFQKELSVDEYAKLFVLKNQDKYSDSQLARILGFSRKTLWEKRKKWNLIKNPNA